MLALQPADVHASLLFVCDLNGHHRKRLDSTTTNRHGGYGVVAFDFTTVPGCDHLVVGSTHACGGTFDLMHDV